MFELTWKNCFLLLIPVLIWNVIFIPQLTQTCFKSDHLVPKYILTFESVGRIIVLGFAIFLTYRLNDYTSKVGLILYIIGSLVYFVSWIPLVYFPESNWSISTVGLLAPFVTPLLIFVGIGLLSHSSFYIVFSVLFIAVHVLHGVISLDI